MAGDAIKLVVNDVFPRLDLYKLDFCSLSEPSRQVNQVKQVNQFKADKLTYISEIDGLRALAVLSVVLFHFFPSWLGGGYLGVDIFFVISGFLITSQLIRFKALQ